MSAGKALLAARQPRRIALFRALHLGDLLCSVPALRALRAAAPAAHITLIGLPWARSFVERYGRYVDELLEYPCGEDLSCAGGGREFAQFLAEARRREFDLAIQLHGSGAASNPLLARLGAGTLAGFRPAHQLAAAEGLFLPWRDSEPEVHRWLRLMTALGAPARGEHLEFPLTEADRRHAGGLLRRARLAHGRYVVLHPGAKLRSRRWPLERFRAVAQHLLDQGWSLALTGSPAEASLTASLAAALRCRGETAVADLAGQTPLGGLAALIGRAALLLSNDTGVSHLAAAMRRPSVIISSGGDARRWAPLDASRHRLLWRDAACRPCAHDECPLGHACALGVSVDEVIQAARAALATRPVQGARVLRAA